MALFLAMTACVGCGQSPSTELPVHLVNGQVTVDGTPQAGVLVELHPIAMSPASVKDLIPTGKTDELGHFQVSTYSDNDGAPEGDYVATFRWMSNASASRVENGDGATLAASEIVNEPPFDQFEDRYSDPQSSQWRVTIISGQNTLEPFQLSK